jgi:hypothetical protein
MVMKTVPTEERAGNVITNSISAAGLILVWSIIWANFPSQEELFSKQSAPAIVEGPRVPQLDLTIPGASRRSTDSLLGARDRTSPTTLGGLSVPRDSRARQIAEVKCEAEVQQYCPDSQAGEDHRHCVAQSLKRLDLPCQQIVRQRLVRWKEAEGYRLACVEEVTRVCSTARLDAGHLLQCLQEHEQELSEGCYQSLPKGRLHVRN